MGLATGRSRFPSLPVACVNAAGNEPNSDSPILAGSFRTSNLQIAATATGSRRTARSNSWLRIAPAIANRHLSGTRRCCRSGWIGDPVVGRAPCHLLPGSCSDIRRRAGLAKRHHGELDQDARSHGSDERKVFCSGVGSNGKRADEKVRSAVVPGCRRPVVGKNCE